MFESGEKRSLLATGKMHWQSLTRSLQLGYRRGISKSSWFGREFLSMQGRRYRTKRLGTVDEFGLKADGAEVLDSDQATQAAVAWWSRSTDKAISGLTVGAVVDAYIRYYKINSTDSTHSNEFLAGRWIESDLRKTLIIDLTTQDLQTWFNDLVYEGGMGKASANRIWTVLRAALNYGHEKMGITDKDRWTRIKPFGKTNQPKSEYLTAVQARRLTKSMEPDFRALSLAALYTGGRYGELTKMLVRHVDLDRKQVEFVFTKSSKSRHVPLTPEAVELFAAAIGSRSPREVAFLKENGKAWGPGQQTRRMKKASISAGFQEAVNFHQFRHTFASLLAQNGMSMRLLQELLGHADQRVTVQHYAHVSPERMADEVVELLPSFTSVSP